jgi:hypothetical protein
MINFIIIIFLCVTVIIIGRYYNNNYLHVCENFQSLKKSKCWIPNNIFPESEKIFNSKEIILKDLQHVLDSDEWGIWSSDYNSTPIFTKMTDSEIVSRIKSNSGKINSSKNPSWRLFPLILNKEILPTAKFCPNTMKILQLYSSKILNAGFSLLEPGCYIGEHRDFNNKFYRLHIPLIIPKINNTIQNSFITQTESDNLCVLQVETDYRIWKENEYFIFDDTCLHNAWNNTRDIRIVLLVDLLK